jgi:isopenicillin N synthase-like dioxygenase
MPSTAELKQFEPVIGRVSDAITRIAAPDVLQHDESKRHALVTQIRAACLDTGFFYLTLSDAQKVIHGRTFGQMEHFFALDDTDPVKQDVCRNGKDFGWMPAFSEPAYQAGTVAQVESFDCGLADVDEMNPDDIWPSMPGFREDVSDCWNGFSELGAGLLSLISEAAGLDAGFLPGHCDSKALNTFRLLHYPATDHHGDEQNVGISAHTDFECITLICQTAPGLELTDNTGNWFDAPTDPGHIVVILGDMLERWTNTQFRATGHRVRSTSNRRFSLVMFFAANQGIEIAPLPDFVSKNQPARYAATTQERHIDTQIALAEKNSAMLKSVGLHQTGK